VVFIDCILPASVVPEMGIAVFEKPFRLNDGFYDCIDLSGGLVVGFNNEAIWSFSVSGRAVVDPCCDNGWILFEFLQDFGKRFALGGEEELIGINAGDPFAFMTIGVHAVRICGRGHGFVGTGFESDDAFCDEWLEFLDGVVFAGVVVDVEMFDTLGKVEGDEFLDTVGFVVDADEDSEFVFGRVGWFDVDGLNGYAGFLF